MHRLSLQFPEITLQIANCRENTRETVSLLTASSARQSVSVGALLACQPRSPAAEKQLHPGLPATGSSSSEAGDRGDPRGRDGGIR
jgi:hypothetical protein